MADEPNEESKAIDANATDEKTNEADATVEDEASNEDAEEAMRQFAQITGTDEIFAQTILQDVNWKLDAALDVYFGREGEVVRGETGEISLAEPPAKKRKNDGEQGNRVWDIFGTRTKSTRNKDAENDDNAAECSNQGDVKNETLSQLEMTLLSYNIDGTNLNNHATRMLAVANIIAKVNADFVFLQEVASQDLDKLTKLRNMYEIFFSNREAVYFTAILVSKELKVLSHDVIHFRNSGMGRTLQIIEGEMGPFRVYLLNTHLESMAKHAEQRKQQLRQSLKTAEELAQQNPRALIFFGGDLNLRDAELGPLPSGFADAWLSAGAPKKEEWTWDSRKNTNIGPRGGVRCRFDRIFYKAGFEKVSFSLEGTQMIRTSLCYPSDHFAISCVFSSP